MNARLRREIRDGTRAVAANDREPIAPIIDPILQPQLQWPEEDENRDERPYYLRND